MESLKKQKFIQKMRDLNTPTSFRPDASYSVNHVNYVDQISTSNNKATNSAGFDSTKV
jgi:hypothetical protein